MHVFCNAFSVYTWRLFFLRYAVPCACYALSHQAFRPRIDIVELWGRFQRAILSGSTDEEGKSGGHSSLRLSNQHGRRNPIQHALPCERESSRSSPGIACAMSSGGLPGRPRVYVDKEADHVPSGTAESRPPTFLLYTRTYIVGGLG